MKWIIYFCCYYSGVQVQDEIDIAGRITVSDSVVHAYIWPYSYAEFSVDKGSWWKVNHENTTEIEYATLYLTHPNGSGIMTISPSEIIFFFHFEGGGLVYKDNVIMKRLKPNGINKARKRHPKDRTRDH